MTTNDAIFMHEDCKELFQNKTVIVLGDSIQRSVYKDLVCLFSDPSSGYVLDHELRLKGELCFRNDRLIRGGVKGEKVNSTNYREEREFREGNTVFRFYFITRCWNEYVESIVHNDMTSSVQPDVIVMNSCLWDIHHYGEEGKQIYEQMMTKLFTAVSNLPSYPLLVWNAALPLAEYCKGGFLRQGFKTLPAHEVVRGNLIAHRLTQEFNFVFVDLYRSISRHEIFRQADDGIHWSNRAHRNMTNSILAAICHRWRMTVPVPVTLLRPPVNEWFTQSYLPPPIVTPPGHRYHPYMVPLTLRNREMGSIGHHRSFTDPFPLNKNYYYDNQEVRNSQYKARFTKMNKIKSPANSPLSTKPADRQPLKESNAAGKSQVSSPATKTTIDTNTTPQTKSPDNEYKDCEDCKACKDVKDEQLTERVDKECAICSKSSENMPEKCCSVVDDNAKEVNGSDNTIYNSCGKQNNAKQEQGVLADAYKDCECCGPKAVNDPESTGDSKSSPGSPTQECENQISDKKVQVDSSTVKLVVSANNDINNNDDDSANNDINNNDHEIKTNESERKFENRDDDDIDDNDEKNMNQPAKRTKLA